MSDQPYTVRDSGKRESYDSGMVRDTAAGKTRPDLVRDGPMYLRWVRLLTLGAVKYAARNWMKASGQAEYDRFLESTDRHYTIWYTWRRYGINIENPDKHTREPLAEDHGAATWFNMNGVEYCADEMAKPQTSAAAVNRPYVPTLPGTDSQEWRDKIAKLTADNEVKPKMVFVPQRGWRESGPTQYMPGTIQCSDTAPCEMCGKSG